MPRTVPKMALSTAVRFSRRARVPSTIAAVSVGAAGAGHVPVHFQQQVRGIRFGRVWSSFFDDEAQRVTCRRTRRLRYRYTESTIRRPGWDGHPFARDGKAALKRMIHDCWTPQGSLGPSVNSVSSDLQQSMKKPEDGGVRREIEDVDRGYGDPKSPAPCQYDYWQSPWQNIRNQIQSELAQTGASHEGIVAKHAPGSNSGAAHSYIDPVTNRRVPLSTCTDIPVRTFQADQLRSRQIAEQAPIFYDGPPPEAELDQYRQVNLDPISDWECKEPISKRLRFVKKGSSGPNVHQSKPISPGPWSVGSSLDRGSMTVNACTTENPSKYNDLAKYKPISNESGTAGETRASPASKDSSAGEDDALNSHGTVRSPEHYDAFDPQINDFGGERDSVGAPHKSKGRNIARTETAEVDDFHRPVELDQYKALRSHEPDGLYQARSQAADADLTYDPHELARYGPITAHEPDGLYKTKAEAAEKACDAKNSSGHGPLRGHEPDEKYAARGPEPTNYQKMLGSLLPGYVSEPTTIEVGEKEGFQAEEGTSAQTLTGNFTRDFPEELFTKPWRSGTSSFEATLESEDHKYPSLEMPIEPALDRHEKRGPKYNGEAGSRVAADESAKTWPEANALKSSRVSESTSSEPTLYKILAYDPTMQTVNVAETTSVVPDSATPLPPAEVLLRLSNPTKFFPHFGPLQAQGFEIVSGSGDVLVFRKVRPATAEADATEEGMSSPGAGSAAAKPSVTSAFRKHVNPIDMMGFEPLEYGGTAASRFASPTGFVNYDLPPAPEPARFASGINVRREEDVFSGAKDTRQQDQGKARKSLPRRLAISAAWVGGVSYALGVVSEYFKTGGSDGKGPKGF